MSDFERDLFRPTGSLEPKPMSDGLHNNRAVGLGGRMSWQYAWDLSAGGVGRDYVVRALLARGIDPAMAKDLVVAVFEARKQDYRARGRRDVAIALGLLALAALLAIVSVRQCQALGADDVQTVCTIVKRATAPAAFGVGFGLWGLGLLRRASRL